MRESICRRISAESQRQAGFTLVEVLVAPRRGCEQQRGESASRVVR
ncbi:MAG: prepilin-type N-terminal cleavage/methylation domain-containing protein [Deltaproteobacteria bacterium]|nr:prepilin-type N-terminal cleavage/methylation domain-containing protein [Deltaproteobacteria bacterium]